VTTAATVLTPFGPRVWSYAYDLSANPVIRHTITEWAPLTLGSAAGWLAIGSFLAVVAYLVRRPTPTPWTAQLTLALFFLIALNAQRALVWWAVVAPAVVGVLIGSDREHEDAPPTGDREPSPRLPAYAIVGVLLVAIVALLPWWRGDDPARFLRNAPSGVTAAANQLPTGTRTLVFQPWASWFEYANPSDPVFVDSRIEVPPRLAWDDYAKVASGAAQWSVALDRWKVDAVVAPNDWAPVPLLEAPGSGWRVAYRDAESTLFRRT
jgi:hypothetical protein